MPQRTSKWCGFTSKALREEITKREQDRQSCAQKLEQLLRRQSNCRGRNQGLAEECKRTGESQQWKDQVQASAQEQQSLQQETEQATGQMERLREQLQQKRQDEQSTALSPDQNLESAKQHLEEAVKEQGSATEYLEQKKLEPAEIHQAKAMKELEAALSQLNKTPQEQEKPGQNRSHPPPEQPPEPARLNSGNPGSRDKETAPQAERPLAEKAQEIFA